MDADKHDKMMPAPNATYTREEVEARIAAAHRAAMAWAPGSQMTRHLRLAMSYMGEVHVDGR